MFYALRKGDIKMTGIFLLSDNIISSLISGATGIIVALVTSIGAFQVSVKKDREKAKQELKDEMAAQYQRNFNEVQAIKQNELREIKEEVNSVKEDVNNIKDDLTDVGANLQSKIAVIDTKVEVLSNRVEKHNQVIERTFKLEQAVADLRDNI